MRGSLLVLAMMVLAACGSRRVVVREAPPPAPSGGVVIVESNGVPVSDAPASASCQATLYVHSVQVRASCTIDARVTSTPGTLTYPCAGGTASGSFEGSTFQGTVSAQGDVTLDIQTAFDFTDGCRWTTKQTIRGSLQAGALTYEYREEPVAGQRGCAAACLATAQVNVAR